MIDGQEPCLGRVERIWRARRGCGVHEARAAEHPDGVFPAQRVQSGLGDRGAVDGNSLYRVAGRPVAYRFSSHLSGNAHSRGFQIENTPAEIYPLSRSRRHTKILH